MPNSPNEEVKAMEDVFSEIVDLSDEELKKKVEDDAKKPAETGESNKEQAPEADPKPAEEDPKPAEVDPGILDTNTSESALQAKVDELEAELKKEHQRTSSWDGRIKAANTRVKELEAENAALREKKPAVESTDEGVKSEQEVFDSFLTTFPEFTEVLDIMKKKIDAKATPAIPAKETYDPEFDHTIDTTPAPKEEAKTGTAQDEHMGRIRKAHPAVDEMVSQGVIKTWINNQPDFISSHLMNIYQTGNSDQLIKMITEFQKKTGWKSSLNMGDKEKEDKLNSMLEAEGQSPGPKTDGPDKSDFNQGAKDAGL